MASDPGQEPRPTSIEPGRPVLRPPQRSRAILTNRRLWLGMFLSLGCLVLAMIDIDFGEMAAALRSANPAWMAAAAVTVLLTGWAKAWRWHLLLYLAPVASTAPKPLPDERIGLPRLTNIWMAGTGVNLALPVPRGGDVLRVYLAGEAGSVSKPLVLGTIAAEKLLDMVMLALCFLGLLLFVAMPQELAQRQTPTVGVAVLLVLVVAGLLWQRERVVALASRLLQRLPYGARAVESLDRGLHGLAALRRPSRLLGAVRAVSPDGGHLVRVGVDQLPHLPGLGHAAVLGAKPIRAGGAPDRCRGALDARQNRPLPGTVPLGVGRIWRLGCHGPGLWRAVVPGGPVAVDAAGRAGVGLRGLASRAGASASCRPTWIRCCPVALEAQAQQAQNTKDGTDPF